MTRLSFPSSRRWGESGALGWPRGEVGILLAMSQISLEEFTAEARSFLEANAKAREEEAFKWGEGEDNVALFDEKTPEQELAEVAEAQEWRRTKFDAGFGWISGPAQYGGRELPAAYDRAYASLEGRFDLPSQAPFGIGLGMVAPTILSHATPTVKERYLGAMYRGDVIGCQLFSEPGAGSDLAGLSTKALRDGDEWVVNGQKVWTSGAQYSDIGEIICRTNPEAPKHKGLTGFVVDMRAPGVEVRPLRQMTGGASFNEVYFTDVRIPDDHRLGDVNEGWTVALTTLMNERASIGADSGGGAEVVSTTRLIEMARHFGRDKDPVVRQELMKIFIDFSVAKYTGQRAMDKIKAGQLPGPELSILKLSLTQNLTATAEFVARVLGPHLAADSGAWGTYSWNQLVLGTPGMRIAGGSDEVMRNIVGERVLGLPKEPRVDK